MTNEELVALVQDGIDTADNMLALWIQMRKFITMLARKYCGRAEMDDLEQEGYIALNRAVDNYKADTGVPFVNYAAYWIRQGMRRYTENCAGMVRIPVYRQEKQREYKRTAGVFSAAYGREPTRYETAALMGISEEQVTLLEESMAAGNVESLDYSLPDRDGDTLLSMIPAADDVEGEALEQVWREELREVLWPTDDTLPDRQSEVIRMRYQEGKTLKETGAVMGVTPERVRTIEKTALHRLRTSGRARKLYPFLPEYVEGMAYRHNGIGEFSRTWTSSTELAALKIYEEITGHVLH